MGQQRVVHVLEEEGCGAEGIERDAVGQFYEVELLLFGEDVVDVGVEEGVGFDNLGTDGALGAGLYFGFRRRGYARRWSETGRRYGRKGKWEDVLLLKHGGGLGVYTCVVCGCCQGEMVWRAAMLPRAGDEG
jgi:hypothetical protein